MRPCDSKEVKEIVERINANVRENAELWKKLREHSKIHGCHISL